MSDLSLEDKESYQDLLDWKEKTWRQGSGGPSGKPVSNDRYQYISGSQLKEKFTKPHLQQLLDDVFAGSDSDAPDADTILEDYLRPLLILVLMGRGRLILHFLKQAGLRDNCLPFLTPPHKFPKSVDGSDLFAAFCKLQWRFCPVELKSNMRLELCSDHILPLQYEKMLAGGGSAVTYRIKVDAEYNKVEHPNQRLWDTVEENRNTYVIKSYQTDEAQEYYDNECSGFRKLKRHPNIIGFYGNFTWDKSRNIILEYADRGTLEDYMRRYDRPYHVKDFEQVWSNYLSILHGLITIHGEEGLPGKKEIMLGWHQDLNPKNILVKSGKTTSPYDCHFKIADLGLSHFERSVGGQDPTAKDSHGTYAYGPPETCRPDPDIQSWRLKVKQSVDIWAFGCISSEFATWVALGYNKVEEYRSQRGIEFMGKTGKSGHCFHDLQGVLDAVDENHKEIYVNHGKTDRLTPRLTENIIQEILRANSAARPPAKYLYDRSSRILDAETLSTDIQVSTLGLGIPQSTNRNVSHGWLAALPTSPRILRYDAQRYPIDNFGAPSGSDEDSDEFYRETPLPHNPDYKSDKPPMGEDPETEAKRRSNQPRHVLEIPQQLSHRPSNIPDQPQDDCSLSCMAGVALQNENSPRRRQFPRLSLSAALEFKRQNETGELTYSSYSHAPHVKLIRILKDRDHVFVIDLAKSMLKYRMLMSNWLELLGYITQYADPDSLEVYYTGSFRKSKAKNYADLLKIFNQKSFEEAPHPNVPKILAKILEDYQNQLGKRHIFRPLLGIMPNRGPRKMSIYVLTDGDWGLQNSLKTHIRSLVNGLSAKNMNDKQVGIQFLRFGNVTDGRKNLEELDCFLGLELDIVDTEPAEGGDVYKAMLGPVDENYDGDSSPSTITAAEDKM